MRKGIIGVGIAVLVLCFAAFAFAAKLKTPVLTPVTIAVDGLHCQACVDELQKDLGKVPGVSDIKVTLKPGQVTAKLDESKVAASKFVNVIATHPRAMDHAKTYGAKLVANIDTAMCAKQKKMCDACFTEIPKVLKGVKGVSNVTLDATGKVATIGFAKDAVVTTSALAKALSQSNFKFTVTFASTSSTVAQQTTGNDKDECELDTGGCCNMGSGRQGCGM